MNSIKVNPNKKTQTLIYKRYFDFERSRQLRKPTILILFAVAAMTIAAGFILDVLFIIIIGFALDLLLMLLIMLNAFRFKKAYTKIIYDIDSKESEHFEFSFDNSKLRLVDIISEKIIGEELFMRFYEVLCRKTSVST